MKSPEMSLQFYTDLHNSTCPKLPGISFMQKVKTIETLLFNELINNPLIVKGWNVLSHGYETAPQENLCGHWGARKNMAWTMKKNSQLYIYIIGLKFTIGNLTQSPQGHFKHHYKYARFHLEEWVWYGYRKHVSLWSRERSSKKVRMMM